MYCVSGLKKKRKLPLNNKNNIYLVSTSLTQPAEILVKASVRVDYHRHVIFPCVYTHVNSTHVNIIEARYKVSSLNVNLNEVQLLRLRATFYTLPLFYLQK